MKPFQKILVPVDFSAHTKRVLHVAAELCRRYEAPVTLLHVRPPELFAAADSSGIAQAHAVELLIAANHVLQSDGALQVQLATTAGRPGPGIVRFAKEGGFDLIVMGTHGRSGVTHALMGSTAEEVMRRATCAVMTVRLDIARDSVQRDQSGPTS